LEAAEADAEAEPEAGALPELVPADEDAFTEAMT
jgi:hypothetical protein